MIGAPSSGIATPGSVVTPCGIRIATGICVTWPTPDRGDGQASVEHNKLRRTPRSGGNDDRQQRVSHRPRPEPGEPRAADAADIPGARRVRLSGHALGRAWRRALYLAADLCALSPPRFGT